MNIKTAVIGIILFMHQVACHTSVSAMVGAELIQQILNKTARKLPGCCCADMPPPWYLKRLTTSCVFPANHFL